MKFLVVVLLLLNIGLWYGFKGLPEPNKAGSVASGDLPRVGSLKVAGSGLPGVPEEQRVPEGKKCVVLGWFSTAEDARALAEKTRLLDRARFEVIREEREQPPLHWVIIPPQPQQVALAQLRKLRAQGVDSYLVTEGRNRNAISLGLFESRNAAISVLEEKKHQNLNAILANFTRNQISYALSFEVSSELVEKQVQAVEADYGNNFDFIEINTCKGVATPAKNP